MKNIKQGVFLLCGFLLGIAISALPIKQEQPDQQMIDLFNGQERVNGGKERLSLNRLAIEKEGTYQMSGATALLEINTSLFNDNKMIELRMENINNFYTLLAVADPKIKDKILPIKNMGFVGKPMMEEDITRTEISLLLTNQNQLPLTTLQAKNPNTSLFIVPNLSDYPSLLLYITKIPVDSSQLLSTIDVVLH